MEAVMVAIKEEAELVDTKEVVELVDIKEVVELVELVDIKEVVDPVDSNLVEDLAADSQDLEVVLEVEENQDLAHKVDTLIKRILW